MANLAATGTMNFSGNWATCDTTSASIAGVTSTAVTTGNLDSAAFTPGAITIDGVYLNLALRAASPTGTFTCTLILSAGGTTVVSTTVNVSDLPAIGASAQSPGAWVFISWGSTLLLAATAYKVRVTSSSSSQLNLYSGASNDWNRLIRIPGTTATAGSADRLFISKELTGTGTSNAVTVTGDNNSTTAFGAMDITQAKFTAATGAASRHRFGGNVNVWAGGELDLGTSGTPVPLGTACIFELNCASAGQYSLRIRAGATFNFYGGTKTKSWSKLTADVAASGTSLTIADSVTTLWKNGDTICLATTRTTASQCETKALSADSVNTALTINAVTNAHLGTAPTQAEVGNLTRNVIVQSVSASNTGYILFDPSSTVAGNWTEFTNLSDNANAGAIAPFGVGIGTTSAGTCDIQNCSFHDMTVASTTGVLVDWIGASGANNCANITFSNNVMYNCYQRSLRVLDAVSSTFDNNFMMTNNSSGAGICAVGANSTGVGTFTNNVTVGNLAATGYGLAAEGVGAVTTFTGNVSHGNTGYGFRDFTPANNSVCNLTVGTLTCYRNSIYGVEISKTGAASGGSLTINTLTAFGNLTANIRHNVTSDYTVTIDSATINAGATDVAPIGLTTTANISVIGLVFTTSTFGSTTTHSTGDIDVLLGANDTNPYIDISLQNCTLSSTNQVANQSRMSAGANAFFKSQIRSSRNGQVAGAYKSWFRYGTIINDTSVYHTASPSEKMTPNNASFKLQSGYKTAAVASGQAATVSVWINKNASYNGNQPRLMVRKNVGAGISADTALATYSSGTGSWNQISGATVAVTEDCVLEFFVDCDGTAGFINVDDYTLSVA